MSITIDRQHAANPYTDEHRQVSAAEWVRLLEGETIERDGEQLSLNDGPFVVGASSVRRHYGPGAHPGTGTDQAVHGGDGGRAQARGERIAPNLVKLFGDDVRKLKEGVETLARRDTVVGGVRAGPVRDIYPPGEPRKGFHREASYLGLGDYWVLPDGTLLEVESHEDSADWLVKTVSDQIGRPVPFAGYVHDVWHLNSEYLMLALGWVRWSSTGTRGLSLGEMKMTDEQAGRVSEMAGNTGYLENLPWESFRVTSGNIGAVAHDKEGRGVEELLQVRHYGPGAHPGTGTEQQVHAGDGGGRRQERPAARLDTQLLDRPGLSPFGPADQERAEAILAENLRELTGDDYLDPRNEVYVAPSGKAYDVNSNGSWMPGHEGAATELFNRLAEEKATGTPKNPEVGKTDWKEMALQPDATMLHHWVSEVLLEGGGHQKATLFEFPEAVASLLRREDQGSGRFEAILSWSSKLRFFETREEADEWIREQAAWQDHTPWPWTDASGEELMRALGFLRISRQSSSSAGFSWSGTAGLTEAQIRKASAVARDAVENGGMVIWETWGPYGNGVVESWPDREFTAALRGESPAVSRSYWDLPGWARALLIPRRGPLRRRGRVLQSPEAWSTPKPPTSSKT